MPHDDVPATLNTDATQIGRWLFRQRSWLPVPLAAVLIAFTHRTVHSLGMVTFGIPITCIGEGIRLWAVRHIGTVSRTRARRTGPLVTSGPYALVRNPLYVGNWFLWMGIALVSGVLWMLPIVGLVFALIYGRLVAWEEQLLIERHPSYAAYRWTVPPWVPRRGPVDPAATQTGTFGWRAVFFSERGTLLAISAMLLLLILRQTF